MFQPRTIIGEQDRDRESVTSQGQNMSDDPHRTQSLPPHALHFSCTPPSPPELFYQPLGDSGRHWATLEIIRTAGEAAGTHESTVLTPYSSTCTL